MRVRILPPAPPFTLPAPDGKAPVLHTGMTRLDPGREYHSRSLSSVEERRDDTPEAGGSVPPASTIYSPVAQW